MMRAHFQGEAWVNDNAIPCDPEGPADWTVSSDLATRVVVRNGIDNDDVLKDDPAAPEWVREWQGPFTITVS